MLKGLLTFGLTRRPLVLLGLLLFIAAGLFAFSRLNIEAYPNPAPVILEITAQAPGLSAEEMERYYTIPIEVGIAATPGVDVIRSTSFYGLSFVRVTFNYGVDYYFALTQTAINLQQNVSLPNGVTPQIQATSLVGEIYRYQVVGPPHFGLTNLRTVQDWIVQRRLLTVPGVVQVNTWGGTTKEYDVDVDLHKLDAYNVTLPQVIAALGNANVNVGGRTINFGEQSVNIRGVGLMNAGGANDLTQGYHVEDIENVPLGQSNGVPIFVKDVATVSVGTVPRLGKMGRDNDDDVVAAIVVMNRTLHTNDVVARVRAEIQRINADGSLPPGVKLVPYYDRTQLVDVTTETVLHNLVNGCLLIFFIQWIFLGDLRSAIIVGANIPFALFFSIIIMVTLGEDANLLSVGAIDFGIIVDAAVILVENVYRNFQSPPELRRALLMQLAEGSWGADPTRAGGFAATAWNDRLRLILASALQVDKAVFFSTAIIVAAFIPLFTMQGVEGQIFGPMARTYAYALVGALIATFTVTPCLTSFLISERVTEAETIVVRWLRSVYTPVLRWSLDNRGATVAVGLLFLAATAVVGSRLGSEFLPTLEEGNLWIRASMPPTISLEAGEPIVNKIREILLRYPEVITVTSQQGRPDDGSDAAGFYNAEFFVPLKPADQWPPNVTKESLINDMQAEFDKEFVGVEFNFSQYIQDNVEEGLSGVKGANSAKIIGSDLQTLEKIARQCEEQMAKVEGITDLGVFWVLGQPNLNIRIDRTKAARYGLNVGDVNNVVQAALGGTTATTLLESDRQFGVVVRLAKKYRDNIDDVRNIKVGYQTPSGVNGYVPLGELASISLDTGASYIFRERNQRFVPIKFSVRGRDLAGAVEEAQQRITANVRLPTGYRIEWSGEFEWLQQAKQRLAIIVPVTFVFIVVLLYGLFNSWRDSLLALLGLPFAVCGGVLGLYVSGLDFSISAAIGFISLFGVSVMSGILIINGYYRVVTRTGMTPAEAMFHAVQEQMRPVLMMTLSACIGLLPAAISTGIGSQVQRPLATVIVGGMLIGPIMLLVIVPALQTFLLDSAGGGSPPAPPTEPDAPQIVE